MLAALALSSGSAAQQGEIDLSGFAPTGKYILVVGGAEVPDAKLFSSQRAGSALLIVTSELPSQLLLQPRGRSVTSVKAEALAQRADGAVDLSASALEQPLGSFEVTGDAIRLRVFEQLVELKERPWLLGSHNATELLAYSPGYAFHASSYEPSEAVLRWLREQPHDVRLTVFFGTWCPYCIQTLPKVLKLAEILEGTQFEFEFYGLPKPFAGEPAATRAGITGVPTGVVYRNGEEVARIYGARWRIPELALRNALMGALPVGG
jgi:thiol-disulfide isomerase/thioredoxin